MDAIANTPPSRRLGAATATLLVVANMVGTGIFTTSGFLIRDLASPLALLLAWLVGGLLALCGALAYAELGAALPRNGGEYQLLGRIYHPAVGFVAGWVSLLVGFSAPIAASALAFGRYLERSLLPGRSPLLLAAALVVALTALHALRYAWGAGFQNGFTLLKIGLIAVLIVGGLTRGDVARIATGPLDELAAAVVSPAFAVGLIFISFAYSGWNASAYLAGEIREPGRTLPRALLAGTAIVVALYLGLNLVFLMAVPAEQLAGVVEVGHVTAEALFGARAGRLLSGLIALALVSSVSAMVMAGPRVYGTMGEDYRRLLWLAGRTRDGSPALAIVLQGALALVLLLSASFEALLVYIGATLSLSAGLTVLGVLVLRRHEPGLERPYRAWGLPWTALVFVALSGWMLVHTFVSRPLTLLASAASLALGVVLWWILREPDRPALTHRR